MRNMYVKGWALHLARVSTEFMAGVIIAIIIIAGAFCGSYLRLSLSLV